MNNAWERKYTKYDQQEFEFGTVLSWMSRGAHDPTWDTFLQTTPLGQYQQASFWARAKAVDRWKPVRVVLTLGDRLVGGFQMLKRPVWWSGIAYVSKGPVVLPGYPGLSEYAARLVQMTCRTERVAAVVVQPPDLGRDISEVLEQYGFIPDVVNHVNAATWMIDVGDGFETVERGMRKHTRQQVRQAIRRQVTLREGSGRDVETFFDLMAATCKRQGVKPNPSSAKHLRQLWDAAEPSGFMRMFFAEYQGRPLAGLFCILFGDTATLWKKGWSSEESGRHPNDLCGYEAVKWACRNGYKQVDFCALDEGIAIALLNGRALSVEHERTRHLFNIRFGGRPQILPVARIYFRYRLTRFAYKLLFRRELRAMEERIAQTGRNSGSSLPPRESGIGSE